MLMTKCKLLLCLALLYVLLFSNNHSSFLIHRRSYSEDTDDNSPDGGGDTSNPRSFFFSPSEVPSQIENSSRLCVQACCQLLGYEEKGDKNAPNWKQAVQAASPENSVICHFASAQDLINLPPKTLDSLIVATLNKNQGIAGHAMVIWKKDKSQLCNGNKNVELFNPGILSGTGTRSTVNLGFDRTVAKWNMIWAAFLPDTTIHTSQVNADPIDLISSDEEECSSIGTGKKRKTDNVEANAGR